MSALFTLWLTRFGNSKYSGCPCTLVKNKFFFHSLFYRFFKKLYLFMYCFRSRVRYSLKTVSPGRLSKGKFPKWQLPKCALSLAATSQTLGCHGDRTLRLEWNRVPSGVTMTDLGSCRLGNFIYKKLPLGKMPLGKYQTFCFIGHRHFLNVWDLRGEA